MPLASFLSTQVFPPILTQLRETMLDFMVKPKEVLVSIDEDGEVQEEHIENTE